MTYLNNAATTFPKPPSVAAAVAACLSAPPGDVLRGNSFLPENAADRCRRKLAALSGVSDSRRIFFSSGATEALNWIVRGIELGERPVLISAAEHNAAVRPLFARLGIGSGDALSVDRRVAVAAISPAGAPSPDELVRSIRAIRPGTVLLSHRTNLSGVLVDIDAAADACREVGAQLVVDASQSAGNAPVRADEWGAAAVVFAGHKGLFGPSGIGAAYIREGAPIRPVAHGGTGGGDEFPESRSDLFEVGTKNAPGIAGLEAGIDFVEENGVKKIGAAEGAIGEAMREALSAVAGVRVLGEPDRASPMAAFLLEGVPSADAAWWLGTTRGIALRGGLHCAPLAHRAWGTYPSGCVRASASWFSSAADVAALAEGVREFAGALARGRVGG